MSHKLFVAMISLAAVSSFSPVQSFAQAVVAEEAATSVVTAVANKLAAGGETATLKNILGELSGAPASAFANMKAQALVNQISARIALLDKNSSEYKAIEALFASVKNASAQDAAAALNNFGSVYKNAKASAAVSNSANTGSYAGASGGASFNYDSGIDALSAVIESAKPGIDVERAQSVLAKAKDAKAKFGYSLVTFGPTAATCVTEYNATAVNNWLAGQEAALDAVLASKTVAEATTSAGVSLIKTYAALDLTSVGDSAVETAKATSGLGEQGASCAPNAASIVSAGATACGDGLCTFIR